MRNRIGVKILRAFTPLEKIYWLRLSLGIVAALVSAGYGVVTGRISNTSFDFTIFFNSLALALVVYLLSYYVIKAKFATQVAKPTKLMTTGIGIFFIAWLVFWVLLYTLIAG